MTKVTSVLRLHYKIQTWLPQVFLQKFLMHIVSFPFSSSLLSTNLIYSVYLVSKTWIKIHLMNMIIVFYLIYFLLNPLIKNTFYIQLSKKNTISSILNKFDLNLFGILITLYL